MGLAAFAGWFSSISSFIYFLAISFLAARGIVDNGSISPKGLNKPLLPLLSPERIQAAPSSFEIPSKTKARKFLNPLAALKLQRLPDTAIILFAYGINYTVYCCLQTSLSTLFADLYHVSGLVTGLIYLPFGVACALSAFATGKLLDVDYRKTAAGMRRRHRTGEGG